MIPNVGSLIKIKPYRTLSGKYKPLERKEYEIETKKGKKFKMPRARKETLAAIKEAGGKVYTSKEIAALESEEISSVTPELFERRAKEYRSSDYYQTQQKSKPEYI